MIPAQWPDVALLLLPHLRAQHADVTFTRTQQDAPTSQVVLDVEYQQLETPISRRCTVLLEARVKRDNGTADTFESFALLSGVLLTLQRTPAQLRQFVRFDAIVGPRRAKDEQKFEYHEGSIGLVVTP